MMGENVNDKIKFFDVILVFCDFVLAWITDCLFYVTLLTDYETFYSFWNLFGGWWRNELCFFRFPFLYLLEFFSIVK